MTPDDVISFWFGDGDPLANEERWWKKDDAFDALCRTRFGDAIERGAGGAFDDWKRAPKGRLALVLLLDQLSRNVYRGTPRSFAQDAKARAIADEALAAKDDETQDSVRASFLLLPLMHTEDTKAQEACIARFEAMHARETDERRKKTFANNVKFAKLHADVIARFGRFPHRNAILGRESTPEEVAFLKEPGSSF